MVRNVEFELEIDPVGKGRPRAVRVGRGVRMHNPPKTAHYENAIRFAAKCAMGEMTPMEGPIKAVLVFSLPIPASWSNRKTVAARLGEIRPLVAPDVDNLSKAILDGCNGVVFVDDRQVVTLLATKRYADKGRVAVSFGEIADG